MIPQIKINPNNPRTTAVLALAGAILLVLVFSVIGSQYYGNKLDKAESENAERTIQIAKLEVSKAAMIDSLDFYRDELSKVIKLAVVQELTLKTPPNEQTILNRYQSMDDSTAVQLFRKRYGNRNILDSEHKSR